MHSTFPLVHGGLGAPFQFQELNPHASVIREIASLTKVQNGCNLWQSDGTLSNICSNDHMTEMWLWGLEAFLLVVKMHLQNCKQPNSNTCRIPSGCWLSSSKMARWPDIHM